MLNILRNVTHDVIVTCLHQTDLIDWATGQFWKRLASVTAAK